MKNHDYVNEQDLCEFFAEYAKKLGWRVFPETSEQDLLLVATEETRTFNARPGDQIAVQAKMHPNIEVLYQAMPKLHDTKGPNYHAVLVPVPTHEFKVLAQRLGILMFEATRFQREKGVVRERSVKSELLNLPMTYFNFYEEPLWHPEIEIIVPAGVRSPKSVSVWKMRAVKLALFGLKKGYLLSSDFREAGMHVQNWVKRGWAEPINKRVGRHMKYRITDDSMHVKYPEIAEALVKLDAEDKTIKAEDVQAMDELENSLGIK